LPYAYLPAMMLLVLLAVNVLIVYQQKFGVIFLMLCNILIHVLLALLRCANWLVRSKSEY